MPRGGVGENVGFWQHPEIHLSSVPSSVTGTPRTVAIVGGGIAGLSTAFALQERAADRGVPLVCTVLEATPRWGGKIQTDHIDDLTMEAGPDSFLSQKPSALELCRRLGLSQQLINTNETGKKAFVFSRGRLRELPEGLVTFAPSQAGLFLHSGLLSWTGLARMGLDLVLPARRSMNDESVAAFFRRRFGREAFERVMEPLMAGIYGGDAEKMSLTATFPRFTEMEREYGSVIRGMWSSRRSGGMAPTTDIVRRTMFVTLRNGLADLIHALTSRLHEGGAALRLRAPVAALRVRSRELGIWIYDLILEDGNALSAEAVVLATPAYSAAELTRPLSPVASGLMEMIPYASTATISMAYGTRAIQSQVEGFGFVVPRVEQRDLNAVTWTSLKWPHRAPEGQTLIRCYVGGVGREEILKDNDEALVARVRAELARIAGVQATPHVVRVNRWHRARPQYTLGHQDRLAEIEMALSRFQGLFVTGEAYRGVGIPDCIRDASTTADGVVRYLARLRAA
ncbi:MAG: protoporphyrinogen oxidase [Nitrospiraceae bacterium]